MKKLTDATIEKAFGYPLLNDDQLAFIKYFNHNFLLAHYHGLKPLLTKKDSDFIFEKLSSFGRKVIAQCNIFYYTNQYITKACEEGVVINKDSPNLKAYGVDALSILASRVNKQISYDVTHYHTDNRLNKNDLGILKTCINLFIDKDKALREALKLGTIGCDSLNGIVPIIEKQLEAKIVALDPSTQETR